MSQARIAIVTGGAQGIGRAIALRLADDGLDVVISDIQSQLPRLEGVAADIVAKGRRSLAIVADVAQEKDVNELVAQVVSKFGGLDVMVANAGISVINSILETTMEEWDRVFNINVKGCLLCFKAAAKVMIEQGRGGKIIAACSIAGKRGAALSSTYCSSKFAVRGLIQAAAIEFGKYGITVNGYAPGYIGTDMLKSIENRVDEIAQMAPNTLVASWKASAALGRLGQPEEIAALVSFLASEDSSFITGQAIIADGGFLFD